MSIIEIKKVSKSYNKKQVLNNINITFEENKIYGLLGRNGAGKTTLLNLITDRAVVDSGEITIDGENVYENDNALEKIYFMTERTLYPEDYKVKEIFKWTKEFYSYLFVDLTPLNQISILLKVMVYLEGHLLRGY